LTRVAVRRLSQSIRGATDDVVAAYREGRISQEPDFTSRLVEALERAINGAQQVGGVTWRAKVLSDRGRESEESIFGADLIGVASLETAAATIDKGFLAQAKRLGPGASMDARGREDLVRQSGKMLDFTPDAFVFLYSTRGVSVVPAVEVVGNGGRGLRGLHSRSLPRFYEEHLECFVGDRNLGTPTEAGLNDLRIRVQARRLLYLTARRRATE